MSEPSVSPRDARFRGFVAEPSPAWAARVHDLYRLLDLNERVIDLAFSGAILDAHDISVEDGGIPVPVTGADGSVRAPELGDALYNVCFDWWVDGIPEDSAPDETAFWGVRKTLENHDMVETLLEFEKHPELPWGPDEGASIPGWSGESGDWPSLDALLRCLMGLQADEGKRALVLDDGEGIRYLVVVASDNVSRVCRDVRELFGARWSVWDDGGAGQKAGATGGATSAPVEPVADGSPAPARPAAARPATVATAAARLTSAPAAPAPGVTAPPEGEEGRLRARRLRRRRAILIVLVLVALVVEFVVLPMLRRQQRELREQREQTQEQLELLERSHSNVSDLPATLTFGTGEAKR